MVKTAPNIMDNTHRTAPCVIVREAAPPSDAGGAAPLAVGDELPDAESLAEPLAESVVETDDEVVRDAEPEDNPDDAVPLLAAVDAPEGEAVAEDKEVMPAPPVGITLRKVLTGRTVELDGEGSSTRSTTILISLHCSPIDSSYKLPNAPLMHRHHLVEPPIARDLFWHTEKPPV